MNWRLTLLSVSVSFLFQWTRSNWQKAIFALKYEHVVREVKESRDNACSSTSPCFGLSLLTSGVTAVTHSSPTILQFPLALPATKWHLEITKKLIFSLKLRFFSSTFSVFKPRKHLFPKERRNKHSFYSLNYLGEYSRNLHPDLILRNSENF